MARNWRGGRDEIDIIGWDGDILVFVEVRTRKAGALVAGEATMTQRKKRALRRGAKRFLRETCFPPRHVRFDVVAVSFCNRQEFEVYHYENVPLFEKDYLPPG